MEENECSHAPEVCACRSVEESHGAISVDSEGLTLTGLKGLGCGFVPTVLDFPNEKRGGGYWVGVSRGTGWQSYSLGVSYSQEVADLVNLSDLSSAVGKFAQENAAGSSRGTVTA